MEDKIVFEAHVYKIVKDVDGEITLTLKVPQIYQHNVINLPTERTFRVTIEGDNA